MKTISESRWLELREARWSRTEAKEVLEAWTASGESARRFASRHGLSAQRLYWWRHRLADEEGQTPAEVTATLVPIRVTGSELRPHETALVHLERGVVLEVPLSASPAWVGAVARSLSEG